MKCSRFKKRRSVTSVKTEVTEVVVVVEEEEVVSRVEEEAPLLAPSEV